MILSISYWRKAAAELKNLRKLILAALLIAAYVALSSAFIPVGANLRVYFRFLAVALSSAVCGPVIAMISGFLSDIIGYIIFPSGAFFPGYTLSAILSALIFALFLYDTRITILKIAIAKLIINVFVNILLGSLWSAILYDKGYLYYFLQSLTKNLLLLPIEIILVYLLLQALLPILSKTGFVRRGNEKILFI